MRIYKANYLHLFQAGLYLAQSDREEMDRVHPGRDPIDVLTASADDPTVMHISDNAGKVYAVGGHTQGLIWFVHTKHAERLDLRGRLKMLRLLVDHLVMIKREAAKARPEDRFHFTNYVSSANTPHLKLLGFLGAVWREAPIDLNGHEFRQFFF